MTTKYWYSYCPDGVKSRYELLVFDHNNQPFLPLTNFYHDCIGKIDKSSILSYLQCLLPFFSWLETYSNYQGNHVRWDGHPEAIKVVVEDYLKNEMGCKVSEKDSFCFVKRTSKSPKTINLFLTALRRFYKSLTKLKQYNYHNPMIDQSAILDEYKTHTEGVRKNKLRMPPEAGTEEPVPHRRLTDSYFKLINEEWHPEIIDDPYLPHQVYQAGKNVNWSLREIVIARMIFESGARVTEVIELTIGDYCSRKSSQEANTFSKGSHGQRVKFIHFGKETVKMLLDYIDTERKQVDALQRGFNLLPSAEPIFLTISGNPYNYAAWLYHWNNAMKKSEMKLNPHKARHWFVTTRMREIFNTSKDKAEVEKRKKELINYMKWSRKSNTIEIYEHHFDEENHREEHDKMLENMEKRGQEYIEQKKNKRKKKPTLTVLETTDKIEIPEELRDLFD
ncbi:tyrosine-type recombinase/integrase [Bacillus mycoides]